MKFLRQTANSPLLGINRKFVLPLVLAGIYLCLLALITYLIAPPESDWQLNYRPAALGLFNGSAYDGNVFNPPWIFVTLLPVALLPAKLGNAVIAVIGAIVSIYILIKLKARPLEIWLFITAPWVNFTFRNGSIDWLIALGFILPPQFGLFLVMAKPQLGIGVAIYWFFDAWQTGGWRKVLSTFTPVGIAYLISFLIFGLPVFGINNTSALFDAPHAASMWPYALPFGLGLLVTAIRTKKIGEAMLCSPLLAPYVGYYTLPFATIGFLPDRIAFSLSTIGFWIISFLYPK